jgi:hypothetical protein
MNSDPSLTSENLRDISSFFHKKYAECTTNQINVSSYYGKPVCDILRDEGVKYDTAYKHREVEKEKEKFSS